MKRKFISFLLTGCLVMKGFTTISMAATSDFVTENIEAESAISNEQSIETTEKLSTENNDATEENISFENNNDASDDIKEESDEQIIEDQVDDSQESDINIETSNKETSEDVDDETELVEDTLEVLDEVDDINVEAGTTISVIYHLNDNNDVIKITKTIITNEDGTTDVSEDESVIGFINENGEFCKAETEINQIEVCNVNINYTKTMVQYIDFVSQGSKEVNLSKHFSFAKNTETDFDNFDEDVVAIFDEASLSNEFETGYDITATIDKDNNVKIDSIETIEPEILETEVMTYVITDMDFEFDVEYIEDEEIIEDTNSIKETEDSVLENENIKNASETEEISIINNDNVIDDQTEDSIQIEAELENTVSDETNVATTDESEKTNNDSFSEQTTANQDAIREDVIIPETDNEVIEE